MRKSKSPNFDNFEMIFRTTEHEKSSQKSKTKFDTPLNIIKQ